MHRLAAAMVAVVSVLVSTTSGGVDAAVSHSNGVMLRKKAALQRPQSEGSSEAAESSTTETMTTPELLGTLVQTHTDERLPLDDRSPTQDRFAALLADRITGEHHDFDPRLLGLLRALAKRHPLARFELVSGYRSPKLNEMMRKKGHHVASHSQHSLGHAVDFRIVLPDAERGIDPRILEREIRELGWDGGVGAYTGVSSDWFVHADVGKNRRWSG